MPGKVTEVQSLVSTIEDAFDGDFIIFQSDEEGEKNANSLIKKVLGDVTAVSAGRQVAIGGVSGCVAGYLTNKVTRMVGLTLAGTFILFQIADTSILTAFNNENWVNYCLVSFEEILAACTTPLVISYGGEDFSTLLP
ncbi:Brain-specific angiogenesis inhibitor 1 [Plakobranchus ocellatus]|uniref:Brain-specific angiogenesis inhibitor 1 n=1 Tax=Plakobranchus ocellatus TaxID=259542 RepID=A0AAV3Z3L3_9GAST|nr:Brain-specific angiogenesis inhibitor 1 [Plakobranchus ocellatus]